MNVKIAAFVVALASCWPLVAGVAKDDAAALAEAENSLALAKKEFGRLGIPAPNVSLKVPFDDIKDASEDVSRNISVDSQEDIPEDTLESIPESLRFRLHLLEVLKHRSYGCMIVKSGLRDNLACGLGVSMCGLRRLERCYRNYGSGETEAFYRKIMELKDEFRRLMLGFTKEFGFRVCASDLLSPSDLRSNESLNDWVSQLGGASQVASVKFTRVNGEVTSFDVCPGGRHVQNPCGELSLDKYLEQCATRWGYAGQVLRITFLRTNGESAYFDVSEDGLHIKGIPRGR